MPDEEQKPTPRENVIAALKTIVWKEGSASRSPFSEGTQPADWAKLDEAMAEWERDIMRRAGVVIRGDIK
jgi:hypothetical protein